jgi:hypothetical protein
MSFFANLSTSLGTVQFWVIWSLIAFLAYGAIKPFIKKIPIINNQQAMIFVGIAGMLITSGIFGTMSFGSVGGSKLGGGVAVSDLQVTTDFGGNCTVTPNNNQDDLYDVRCGSIASANVSETAARYEVHSGIITVFRTGALNPISCPVVASTVENYNSETSPGDGNKYTIVEETTLNELEVYLNAKKSGSGAAASTTSPKERTTLEFDEGTSQAHLGVLMELDVAAMENINQYSYRDVTVNICGKPMTFRPTRMWG